MPVKSSVGSRPPGRPRSVTLPAILLPSMVPLKSRSRTPNGRNSLPMKLILSPARTTEISSSLNSDFSVPSTKSAEAGPRLVVQFKLHASPPGPLGFLPAGAPPILIFLPSFSASLPRTITSAPASSPCRTTKLSPKASPSRMRFLIAMPSSATYTMCPPTTGSTASFRTVTTGAGLEVGTFSTMTALSARAAGARSPMILNRTVCVPVRAF